jgi:class 3 adenylate cyclase
LLRGEQVACWTLVGLALLMAAVATRDAWRDVGQPSPGFAVMESLVVGVGGLDRAGLEPFDVVRAVNGQLLTSAQHLHAEAARHPAKTVLHYLIVRRGQLLEVDLPTRTVGPRAFRQFLFDGLLPALLFLTLGTIVITLRPGARESRLFFGFCLLWFVVVATYRDAHFTYRFGPLFLTAWTFSSAAFLHLALTFPQRRRVAIRWPWVLWIPHAISAIFAVLLEAPPLRGFMIVAAVAAGYWVASLVLLIISLLRTAMAGATPLMRRRARVLAFGFAIGQLSPVTATAIEVVFRVSIPYVETLWRLNLLFPLCIGYAIVRYSLFDIRAVLRLGTIYSAVTAFLVVAYAGAIALVNLALAELEMSVSPLIPAAVISLAVVVLLNPVHRRTQAFVDRVFFRERYDAQRAVERLSDAMTTVLELPRIVALIDGTVRDLFHPTRIELYLSDADGRELRATRGGAASRALDVAGPLPHFLAELRLPVTRDALAEDPMLATRRDACLIEVDALRAEVVVPIVFRDRLTGLLALGPRRSSAGYAEDDLRLLRHLANQSSVALENARAYTELERALRRVELLESIRANLSKFVPKTVQDLIEREPESPALGKQDVDLSVLFVDIVGYTRIAERLAPADVTRLVERYFGAFLDEILRQGGDVNETAGDGLMVLFQDGDPAQHAQAAVLTALAIVDRATQINLELQADLEPVRLHVGVNSGVAAVGATKIEGTAGTRWTYTASGNVTNVASRLAALGDGDGVLLGPETWSRVGDRFTADDLGEQRLKNVEAPVRVFRLSGPAALPPSPASSRDSFPAAVR